MLASVQQLQGQGGNGKGKNASGADLPALWECENGKVSRKHTTCKVSGSSSVWRQLGLEPRKGYIANWDAGKYRLRIGGNSETSKPYPYPMSIHFKSGWKSILLSDFEKIYRSTKSFLQSAESARRNANDTWILI